MSAYTYLDTYSSTSDLSTYTFADLAIGDAAADRLIVVGVCTRGSSGQVLNSVTIGGVTATKLSGTETGASGSGMSANLYAAIVPTGTTASVVAVFASSQLRCSASLYRATGYAIADLLDTATSLSIPATLDVDNSKDGLVIAVGCVFASATPSWTGVTGDETGVVESGMTYAAGTAQVSISATGRAVSLGWNTGTVGAAACASLAPPTPIGPYYDGAGVSINAATGVVDLDEVSWEENGGGAITYSVGVYLYGVLQATIADYADEDIRTHGFGEYTVTVTATNTEGTSEAETSAGIQFTAEDGGTSFDLATTRLVSSGGIYHTNGIYTHESNNSFNGRHWFAVPFGATGLRAKFIGFHGGSESDSDKEITLTASFEKQDGTTVQITVGGEAEFVLPVGGTLVTDQMGVMVPAGQFVAVHCHGRVATPGGWPQGIIGTSEAWGGAYSDGWEVGVDLPDKTLSGTISGSFAYAFNAVGILSDSATNVAIAALGDSIMSGSDDTGAGGRNYGFWGRAYNSLTAANATPNMRLSMPGQGMTATITKRLNLAKCCNVIANQLGVNDYTATLETMQSRHTSLMTTINAAGKPVARFQLTPRCNTDNTVDAHSTKVVDFNDWLETQNDFNELITAAIALHPDTPDGTWRSGNTYHTDGVHPIEAGHALYATGMPDREWWQALASSTTRPPYRPPVRPVFGSIASPIWRT